MNEKQTSIELYIIEAVRKRRVELNLTPNELSLEIGLNRGFVGRVENQNLRAKYSFNHLNEIAKVLKCDISDFLPKPYLETDCIEEYQKIHPKKGPKNEHYL